jgi:hypothetical protein
MLIGEACRTHGEMCNASQFLSENLNTKDHLEDLGVDGRIMLQWILKPTECEGMDWIHLAKDKG